MGRFGTTLDEVQEANAHNMFFFLDYHAKKAAFERRLHKVYNKG